MGGEKKEEKLEVGKAEKERVRVREGKRRAVKN